MKLIIFGSTGSVGRELTLQALNAGHSVTAFSRKPEKFADINHPDLHCFRGDVLDLKGVESAITDHDAVLCALGAGSKGQVRAAGTRNIIVAMERLNIKRLICQTTLGAGDSKANLNFFWKHIMFGFLLKEAFLDHELQEKYIMESSLDWTIVRPGAFTNGPVTGHYQHGFSPTDKTIKLKISRGDVAHFMLKELETGQYIRKTPGLSY